MAARALFHLPPQPVFKGDNQRLAWKLITETAGGVTADEVGALIHAHRSRHPHSVDERCEWCATTGRQTCRSKALAPLVIRRRSSGKYEARDKTYRACLVDTRPDDKTTDDGTWEALFERKAS